MSVVLETVYHKTDIRSVCHRLSWAGPTATGYRTACRRRTGARGDDGRVSPTAERRFQRRDGDQSREGLKRGRFDVRLCRLGLRHGRHGRNRISQGRPRGVPEHRGLVHGRSEEVASDAISAGVTDYLQNRTGPASTPAREPYQNRVTRHRRKSASDTRPAQDAVADLGQYALRCGLDALFERAVESVAAGLNTEYSKVLEYRPADNKFLLRAGVGWQSGLVGEAAVGAGEDYRPDTTLRPKSRSSLSTSGGIAAQRPSRVLTGGREWSSASSSEQPPSRGACSGRIRVSGAPLPGRHHVCQRRRKHPHKCHRAGTPRRNPPAGRATGQRPPPPYVGYGLGGQPRCGHGLAHRLTPLIAAVMTRFFRLRLSRDRSRSTAPHSTVKHRSGHRSTRASSTGWQRCRDGYSEKQLGRSTKDITGLSASV